MEETLKGGHCDLLKKMWKDITVVEIKKSEELPDVANEIIICQCYCEPGLKTALSNDRYHYCIW